MTITIKRNQKIQSLQIIDKIYTIEKYKRKINYLQKNIVIEIC